jgi:hypothetical protein
MIAERLSGSTERGYCARNDEGFGELEAALAMIVNEVRSGTLAPAAPEMGGGK